MGTGQPPDIDELRAELESLARRRDQGHIIELDYPTKPRVRDWQNAMGDNPYHRMIADGEARYRRTLRSFLAFAHRFASISGPEPADEREPYWGNPWLPAVDAICLYSIVATLKPRLYVEVGSGNSTKFVRRAIADHALKTRIISIDPHPRAEIDGICDRVIREPLEDTDLRLFAQLGENDVLFVDNSHRSFQNSDVTVFFTEVLPTLRPGCLYGIHDIFLPFDYPADWVERHYNEQYLLMAYLMGGAGGDTIFMPVHFVQRTAALSEILAPIFGLSALAGALPLGGAFWLKKGRMSA
jgi:hypothetical protein